MLIVNDFFCGAGGMGLGFKYGGFRLGGAWDFDRHAVYSYGENVSPKVKQADITEMSWDEIPHANVWTFGFPCQDISIVGKKGGMIKGKTRSGLFYEIMRLLEETREGDPERLPSIILAENVKMVKKYLPEIEKEYQAQGYTMYYTLYNSKHWGLAQSRERYFIIGVHNSIEKPFHFIQEKRGFIPSLNTILEDEVDETYYISKDVAQPVFEKVKQRIDSLGFEPTCIPVKSEGNIDVIGRINIKGFDILKRVYNPNGISPTLTAGQNGQGRPKIIEYKSKWRVRMLTTREYARLQGFPESFRQVVSDTQFCKQMGNAVSVPVAKSIAEQIAKFLTDVNMEGKK